MLRTPLSRSETGEVVYLLARTAVHDQPRLFRDGYARLGCGRVEVE